MDFSEFNFMIMPKESARLIMKNYIVLVTHNNVLTLLSSVRHIAAWETSEVALGLTTSYFFV